MQIRLFQGVNAAADYQILEQEEVLMRDYTRYFMTVLSKKEERYDEILSPQISIKSKQQFGPNALIDTDDNAEIVR